MVTSPRVTVLVSNIVVMIGVRAIVPSAIRTSVSDAATFPALHPFHLAFTTGFSVTRRFLGRRVWMFCAFLCFIALGLRVNLSMLMAVFSR